jgi:alcohol dehydrogenase (cytochrome c)
MRKALLVSVLSVALPSRDAAQVPYARIARAERDSASWLTYSGNYSGHRYSSLAQVTTANVASLRAVWVYQAGSPGSLETTPLVADGVMYVTEAPSTVVALDVRTGLSLWSWSPQIGPDVRHIGFGRVNRGVALLDSSVYVGTLDAHLVALDARSGAVRWNVMVADNAASYSITLAPLAIDGRIIVGVSGAEAGIRGFVDAYDARSGKLIWRFHTVPAPGEPGSETWKDTTSWRWGGGSTWLTGSFDPALNLIYWRVGNP